MTTIPTSGGTVEYGGETMRVVGPQGFDSLILQSKSGQLVTTPVIDLLDGVAEKPRKPVVTDPKRLAKVPAYKAAFQPLITKGRRTREEVETAGRAVGIKSAAAYKVLARYEVSHDFNDLPPPTRPGGRGKPRIIGRGQKIIEETINAVLLTRRQHRIAYFLKTVQRRLSKAKIVVSETTLRRRIDAIPSSVWIGKRKGFKDAERELAPHRGEAPTGSAPLDIVQVDHWKTDVDILSEDRLTIIGRAWLTLAIDVYTRVVWGWYLGLDHPGSIPTAFCMINGMTRKDGLIRAYGLAAQLPFWGKPKNLHLDNAGEFRGQTMAAACQHFHINLKFRPVESPQFGAHIERLNGTLAGKFKDLPGATGANIGERKALRPAVTAALTFDDLAKQLVMIFDEYHNTPHTGIGSATPLAKWHDHFFNADGRAKRDLPPIILDDLELRIQWYPRQTCTLQAYGIRVVFLDYYNEDIEQLVRNRKDYGKIEVRRNPLDVREIYVLHPMRQEWLIVPCRYFNFPVATIKELQESRREAKRLGRAPTPENLARIIEDRQEHLEEAKKLTKSAARQATIASNNAKMRSRAPKTFTDVAADPDALEILPPNEHGSAVKPKDARTPLKSRPQTIRDESARSPSAPADDFVGAAAAMAELSDDDIDRYLNAR